MRTINVGDLPIKIQSQARTAWGRGEWVMAKGHRLICGKESFERFEYEQNGYAQVVSRGGARKGAGRKPLPLSERKIQTTIRLSPDDLRFLKSIAPNLSQAIRTLIEPPHGLAGARMSKTKREFLAQAYDDLTDHGKRDLPW